MIIGGRAARERATASAMALYGRDETRSPAVIIRSRLLIHLLTGFIDDRKHIEFAEFKFSRHREAIVHATC